MAQEIHGKKRPAQADPDGAQPLTKRFGHLRIDNSMPISARAKSKGHNHLHTDSSTDLDMMWLDDTKHTTYIHDLEQELMEPDSPGLVFSPFAAKVLSVPQSVLCSESSGKELVLYTEPSSLTVPREKDHVRQVILESRARARAGSKSIKNGSHTEDPAGEDPMDIDG